MRGRVQRVVVTDGSVHGSVVMRELLHGEEKVVYGDKTYANAHKRGELEKSWGDLVCEPQGI